MPTPTLTPSASALAVAGAASLCLGARTLAGRAQTRVSTRSPAAAQAIYVAILAGIAIYGAAVLGVAGFSSADSAPAAVPVGVVGGLLAAKLDLLLARRAFRRGRSLRADGRAQRAATTEVGPRRGLGRAAREAQLWQARAQPREWALSGLFAVAFLEELIFRGVLTHAALAAPPAAAWLVMAGACAAFGLSHAPFGRGQASAKTALGAIALLALLITGSLVAAVLVHLAVNLRAWRERPRPASTSGAQASPVTFASARGNS